jgi:HAMP domain-containing protein
MRALWNIKTRLAAAATVIALGAGGLLLAGESGESIVSPASAAGPSAYAVDPYPGFGRTAAASARDETIAAWEAFRRERHIASCMGTAGFDYQLEVTYPVDELRLIAAGLNVPNMPASATSPEQANDDVRATLPAQQRDAYYIALYGETAAAVEAFESGDGASNDESFATGGCTGAAARAIGSVWSTHRQLAPELEALGRAAGMDAATQYTACAQQASGIAATDPGVLEDRVDDPALSAPEQARAAAAFASCMPVWQRAYSEAERARLDGFISEHSDVLEPLRERYATIMTSIQSDEAFRRFLALHG